MLVSLVLNTKCLSRLQNLGHILKTKLPAPASGQARAVQRRRDPARRVA